MAHTCPECGNICHCGGDIDDICFGEAAYCECCMLDDDGDFDDEDDYPAGWPADEPDYDLEKEKT